jgi:tripartite-type tricarboxylate transporter receptor subunit TctC
MRSSPTRPASAAAGAALAALLAVTSPGASQPAPAPVPFEPSKPVELVVTFGKGSQADLAARLMADVAARSGLLPVPITVVNLPAGAGLEAFNAFQERRGDDHALMLLLPNAFTLPLANPAVKLDISALSPVAGMGEEPLALWVSAARTDINTIDDLVADARKRGRDFKIAGPALGTPRAFLAEILMAAYSLPVTYEPQQGLGSTAKLLAERKADATLHNPSEQSAIEPKGVNKPVAFLANARLKEYPITPTFRETGMELTYLAMRSVVGAPGMSPEAQQRYAAVFKAVFDSPEWQAYRARNGMIGRFLTGQPLADYLERDRQRHVRWKMAIDIMRK